MWHGQSEGAAEIVRDTVTREVKSLLKTVSNRLSSHEHCLRVGFRIGLPADPTASLHYRH